MLIVNCCKFDIMSSYGRMFHIGKGNVDMKLRKLRHVAASMFIAVAAVASTQMTMAAFSFTPQQFGEKAVTIIDGSKRKVVRTNATEYSHILFEENINMGAHDTYWSSTPVVENGSIVVIERATPVTIEEDGKTRKIYTTDKTVQGVLNSEGYDWKKKMALEDGMEVIRPNMVIHVVPYTTKQVTMKQTGPVYYDRWYDSTLPAGQDVIVEPGEGDKEEVVVQQVIVDGKVLKSQVLQTKTLAPGRHGKLKTGSRTGENVGKVIHMTATAYHPSDGNGAGITATGTRAGYGTAAVDPRVIPLGSKIYVSGYGEAVAEDTGGAIKGQRIDFCMEDYAQCYSFGRRTVEVFVNY